MMGVINEDVPFNVRRRKHYIERLLNIVLNNSYPCDFVDVNHFTEGILYDINEYLMSDEIEGMSSNEIKDFITDHLIDEIEEYYKLYSEEC